jgi:phage/plasmid-like protein (TIGR03299 family)
MSHEIHEHDSMMSYRETPWHGLGVVIDKVITNYLEAMEVAGLNWKVELRSLASTYNLKTVQFEDLQAALANPLVEPDAVLRKVRNLFVCEDINDAYAVYRTDKNIYLGTVGARFHPMNNAEAFRWFEPFMESGEARFETAGSLFNGKRVWVLAALNRDPIQVGPNDPVNKYLLLSHAHDGSLAIRGQFTPVRVVCNNTLTMARMDGGNKMNGRNDDSSFYFKHTKNAQKKLDDIRETVDLVNMKFDRTGEKYKWLNGEPIRHGKAGIREYARQVFDMNPEKDLTPQEEYKLEKVLDIHDDQMKFFEELRQQAEKHEEIVKEAQHIAGQDILDMVLENVENGTGHELSEGSCWSIYNAATDYLTHFSSKGRDEEKRASVKSRSNRLNSLWYGPNKLTNQKALSLAVDMANDKFEFQSATA